MPAPPSLRPRLARLALALLAAGTSLAALPGQYLYLDAVTDTISIPGDTGTLSQITIEARFMFCATAQPATDGYIFLEQSCANEDKALFASKGRVSGTPFYGGNAWSTNAQQSLVVNRLACPQTWHHLVYQFDGTEERVYLDGVLEQARPHPPGIGSSAANVMGIGALRDTCGGPRSSVLGTLDYVRVSNVARYSGTVFVPPPGGTQTADASTVLLFNFEDSPSSPTARDDGPHGWHGSLGTGFPGATLPQFTASTCEGTPLATRALLGAGCGGTSNRPALDSAPMAIGRSTVLRASNSASNAPGAVLISMRATAPIVLPGNCQLWLDLPSMLTLATAQTDGGGGFLTAVAVPCVPAFAGAGLNVQVIVLGGTGPFGLDVTNAVGFTLGY